MCHYGNAACRDQSDRTHDCPPAPTRRNADGKEACDLCGSFAWTSRVVGDACSECHATARRRGL